MYFRLIDWSQIFQIAPSFVCCKEAKAQRLGKTFAEIEAEAFSYTSIREYVKARQLADQVLFLASPRGRTISGQAISIDGDTKMLA